MERLRDTSVQPAATPLADTRPVTEAAADVARLAIEARAEAAAVPLAPATVTLTVKTTGANQTTIVATPDTTMAEIMTRACEDLGVNAGGPGAGGAGGGGGGGQYLLVTDGQVIADGTRTVRDVVGDKLATTLDARIVKKPEAGGSSPCRS
jgi:hypothetical protein